MTESEGAAESVIRSDVLDTPAAGGLAIRGGAMRATAYVTAMLLSLASVPFMIRHLGAVRYGYFVTVSSITFIIGGFTEAGLTFLGVREYSLLRGRERDLFLRNLVGLRLVLTVTGVALAVAFAALTGQPRIVVAGTLVFGVGMLLALTQQTYSVALSAELRLGWVAILELLRNATISFATIALVLAGAGLLPFYFTSVLGGFVMLVVTLGILRSDAGLAPRFDLARWRTILPGIAPYALAAGVGLIYFRVAVILMSYITTGRETGIYSAAFRIIETLASLPWVVVSAGFPILARAHRDDQNRLRYAAQRLFDVSALVGSWLAVALAIAAPFAIRVVAGPGFEASIPVLRLLSLALVSSFLVVTWSFTLLSMQAYRALLASNAFAALASCVLTLALVPPFGASGAAVATFGAEATLAVAYLIALARRDRGLIPSLGVLPRLLPGLVIACAIGLFAPIASLFAASIAAFIYIALAIACGAVPSELSRALLRRDVSPDARAGAASDRTARGPTRR
jgi:O-antigen/teichoic acid export membrane protein